MGIEITNQQTSLPIDEARLERAVEGVLAESGYDDWELSVAVVDDPTIHELNRRHLDHDYPTDVLSFPLADDAGRLEGEVIVSADTAVARAGEYGWAPADELLLYTLHGVLHLVGYRDKTDEEAAAMRRAEALHLRRAGVEPPPAPAPGGPTP